MNTPIHDDDLLLFHYRDGLDAELVAEIEQRLREEPQLSARYQALCTVLGQVSAQPVPEPDAGFEQRLWRQLDARIEASEQRSWRARLQRFANLLVPPRAAWATACGLVLAVVVGYLVGRQSTQAPIAPQIALAPVAPASKLAPRVLDAYVAAHLRATEGLLLTAANSDSPTLLAGNRDLAASMIQTNRLYALAAARAGNTRLADFLRQLEPLLIDLANRPAAAAIESQDGLRDYLDKTDLLFQVRATQARLEAPGKRRT